MKTSDTLYKETILRVGPDEMRGVERLLKEGHTGIAERHTVSKLITYIRNLESKLGINIPKADFAGAISGKVKMNIGGSVYYEDIENKEGALTNLAPS